MGGVRSVGWNNEGLVVGRGEGTVGVDELRTACRVSFAHVVKPLQVCASVYEQWKGENEWGEKHLAK